MKHGSLFSGIGGFDLAAEWMGWQNVFHCEWNDFGKRVLKHYWPNSISYHDICKTDFTKHYGTIDIISGGFPCQPYSTAGKRLGKADNRHLWPEMLRAIREISPRYVVGENVLGLVNWNGGMVFDEVQADLEAEGYDVQPFVLPASSVNAPHRRDRVWFVAYSTRQRHEPFHKDRTALISTPIKSGLHGGSSNTQTPKRTSANAERGRPSRQGENKRSICSAQNLIRETGGFNLLHERNRLSGNWSNFPTQSPVCNGDDGLPSELDGITFPKWRNESIKAGGNAIVPQVAFQIFKAIQQYENTQI